MYVFDTLTKTTNKMMIDDFILGLNCKSQNIFVLKIRNIILDEPSRRQSVLLDNLENVKLM